MAWTHRPLRRAAPEQTSSFDNIVGFGWDSCPLTGRSGWVGKLVGQVQVLTPHGTIDSDR